MGIANYGMTQVLGNALASLDTNLTYVAVGSDNTTPLVTDTTLGSEDYREARFSASTGPDYFRVDLRLDITENNGNTMLEIAPFNAASSGTMYSRDLVTSLAKDATKEVQYRITYKFTTSTS